MKMLQAAILKVKAQRETNLFSDLLHLLHLLQLGGVFLDFLQSHVCAQPHQVPQAWTNAHSYFFYILCTLINRSQSSGVGQQFC